MSTTETSPPSAAAQAVTKPPTPLTTGEKRMAALLVVLGCLLSVGVLLWFGLSSPGGGLKSKATSTSEPVGEHATGTKTTSETDYSDSVVIFALSAGAALMLAGAFYGRLRELKLGGLDLSLGELDATKQETLDKQIDKIVTEKLPADPKKQTVAKTAARALAREKLKQQYWGVVPKPPEQTIEKAAEAATTQAVEAVAG